LNRKKILKIINIPIIFIAVAGLTIILINQSCSSAKYSTGDKQVNKIEQSAQYRDGKFRNYDDWEQPSIGEFASTMWDFLFGGDQRTPNDSIPRQQVDLNHFYRKGNNQLNVTWLGHSSLMINIDGYKILTDPVFEKKVSLVGPSRYNGDVPLNIYQITEVDVILISHNHYDHLNKFSIQSLNSKTKKFIVPLAVGAQLEEWGVSADKIVELDWWEELRVDENLTIIATPAQHFSGRGLTDRDETLWASFVIKGLFHKIFYSGDSGYFDGFKQIGEVYGPFDLTFIETGAYNEKWHFIHMFPEETVQAHIDLQGKILHPIHWATFNLSLHSWFEPMERLTDAADSLKVKTAIPVVGETTVFNEYIPSVKWWELIIANKMN
jgi:L-ascorbate metabolism protein UlaG (beta-lactamase superfamily)